MRFLLITLYSLTIVSLVWARYRFFELKSDVSRRIAWFYDLMAGLHITFSYFYLLTKAEASIARISVSIALLVLGTLLFFLSIKSARHLNFALSDESNSIVDQGPFALVRHPLYLSYSLIWLSSTILFNSTLLWITLGTLIAFYIFSAKREEEAILRSSYSREYRNYKLRVGMFLPRISQWKSLILKLLAKQES